MEDIYYLSLEQWDAFTRAAELDRITSFEIMIAASRQGNRSDIGDIIMDLAVQREQHTFGIEYDEEKVIDQQFNVRYGPQVPLLEIDSLFLRKESDG